MPCPLFKLGHGHRQISHHHNLLFSGTVPPNNLLFSGTVPPNNLLFGGTLPPNNLLSIVKRRNRFAKPSRSILLAHPQKKLVVNYAKYSSFINSSGEKKFISIHRLVAIRPDKIKCLILVLFFSKYGAGGRIFILFFYPNFEI